MRRRTLLLAVAGLSGSAWGGAAPEEAAPEFIHVAFVESAFQGVNKNDAIAAVTVWADQLQRNRGLKTKSHVALYPRIEDLSAAAQANQADIVAVSAVDYLYLRDRVALDPLYLGIRHGQAVDRYQLLVRRDDAAARLEDLRGESVLIHTGNHMLIGADWLNVQAQRAGVHPLGVTLTSTDKLLGAVMPVFLRQRRAALVTRSGFESMVDLNPQLGRSLRVLQESEPMAAAVICLRHGYTYRRADVVDELGRLSESPRGQQILLLLRYEDLAPFQPAALDTTVALLREAAGLNGAGHPP